MVLLVRTATPGVDGEAGRLLYSWHGSCFAQYFVIFLCAQKGKSWYTVRMNSINIIEKRFGELARRVERLYGIDITGTELAYTGLQFPESVGEAQAWSDGSYTIVINPDYLNDPIVVADTLPHEVAHIVCYMTGKGDGHDEVWQRVCKALGGDGKATCAVRKGLSDRQIDKMLAGIDE